MEGRLQLRLAWLDSNGAPWVGTAVWADRGSDWAERGQPTPKLNASREVPKLGMVGRLACGPDGEGGRATPNGMGNSHVNGHRMLSVVNTVNGRYSEQTGLDVAQSR